MAEMEKGPYVVIAFLLGAAAGSFATYYITRKKMRSEKENEIADVASYYENRLQILENEPIPEEEDHPRDDLPPEDKPFPISQQEYIDDLDFKKETVVWYETDKILTDMFDREMFVDDTIGADALEHFNEDEEDTAYARNEKLGMDYEIILEHKSFASVMGENMSE